VYAALTKALNSRGNYRVVTDVGQHQMWAAQLIDWYRPRTHITSGGAGTMGFAVPAALGVAIAHPNDTVWVICGDGGFQMTNQEMATIVQEGIKNIKIAVINNGYLGMVRQWQLPSPPEDGDPWGGDERGLQLLLRNTAGSDRRGCGQSGLQSAAVLLGG
jgi:acetolactate synthase-1/2/3 large subunit